ncbi:MAG: hypothetical protein AAB421_05180 [Patescibacteria group bacterium]
MPKNIFFHFLPHPHLESALRVGAFAIIIFACLAYGIEIDTKLSAVVAVLFPITYNLYYRPREISIRIAIALVFALTVTNVNHYVYDTPNIYIGNSNLFPLVMWVAGLLLMREIYDLIQGRYRYLMTILSYWSLLFALEYVAYYWMGVRTNQGNPSFLGSGVLHGTVFMHFFYPLSGPTYLLILDVMQKLASRYTVGYSVIGKKWSQS